MFLPGFIKSTDHRPTDHRPNNHGPNWRDSISKTWSMKNIHFTEPKHSWEDIKLYFGLLSIWWISIFIKSLFIFVKSLSSVFFKRKLLFYKRHTQDLIMFVFLHFKPDSLILPRYSQLISTDGNFNNTRCFLT